MATEVERRGRAVARARAAQQEAMAALQEAVKDAAVKTGVSEVELARQAAVNRLTIRRMLGK